MAEKPSVTVIYQDAKKDTGMGCLELALGVLVIGVFVLVVGWWH